MAPTASTLGKTLDLPALILANCATFAGPKSNISLASAVNDNGRWSVHALRARKGMREVLLAAEGDSVISALEELFFQSSRAVHNFKISNGLGYPRQFKVHDEESFSERDNASDVEAEHDGQMSVSVVSVEELASTTPRLSVSVSSREGLQPPAHRRALTPTPPPALALLPKHFEAPRPKVAKELAACLLVNFVGYPTFKVVTRVAPCARAIEARAIQLLLDKKLCKQEDGEDDASPPLFRAAVRQVRLGNEDFELDADMDNDLSSLFSAGEIPRFDVEVISA